MKFILRPLAALILSPALAFAAPAWTIDKTESHLTFQTTQAGGAISGEFGEFNGDIVFDAADLAASRINISISINSIATGATDRDAELPKADWFDTSRFPAATFAASTVRSLGGNQYVADGNLTIRDKTLPISLPFVLQVRKDDVAIVNGSVELDRTAFGVGQGDGRRPI